MTDASEEFLKDFSSDPSRLVFVIDEARPYKADGDQFAIFGAIIFRSDILLEAQAEWYSIATNDNYKPFLKTNIKGQHFYGSVQNEHLDIFRAYAEKWLSRASKAYFMFTSQNYIKLNWRTSYGRVRFITESGAMVHAGAELAPNLIFVKAIANDLAIGEKKVEVLIDEAEQNSYGEVVVGKVKTTQEYCQFNEVSDQKQSKEYCPTLFRITQTPDQTPNFQHALLFPDVACYLSNKYNLFVEGKKQVDSDLFHIREVSINKIIEAASKWASERRPC